MFANRKAGILHVAVRKNKVDGFRSRQNLCYIVYALKQKTPGMLENFNIPGVHNVYLSRSSVL